ncbi:MAG: holo-ACP synthase [Nitrospirota bacterium]|nr:holo-ACP synthase [Nitrospirota bacterium]
MIVGLGMDLVQRSRIEDAIRKHGERFKKRIFTESERAYCDPKPHAPLHYAGMWAVKESLVKALGTGFSGGIGWRDIQVGHDERGKPEVTLSGKAAERAQAIGVTRIHCTITHDTDLSAAQVVLEGN